MGALLLVRYGELALKSPPVRREFERALQRHILEQFRSAGAPCRIRSDRGHLYVEADDGDLAIRLLGRVFGITSVSRVEEVSSDPTEIGDALVRLARPRLTEGSRFAVRARRIGQHPFTSQELARDLGARILAEPAFQGLRVDLEHPDVELFVEVRGPRTYLSFDRHPGPGGLPLGVAGRVVALVDGRRGGLGAWMMMKRGCTCRVIVAGDEGERAQEILERFDPASRIPARGGPTDAAEQLRGLAESEHAEGIVLPLTVDDYPAARALWSDRVVFSPTVGLTDEEVGSRWDAVVKLAT